jgi:hypothetical protein
MGGPKTPWTPGRTDFVDDSRCAPRGRLPDGALAADHLREVFTKRMGFNDQEIVALAGAHSLGVRRVPSFFPFVYRSPALLTLSPLSAVTRIAPDSTAPGL